MNIHIEKIEKSYGEGDASRVLLLLPSKDSATAEDLAMLQALYSRDPRPIDDALRLAKTSKSGEFMNKFYVGYGHSSIGECGTFTLAIENVPMIIAKLIQHHQLYIGQECSTRYLDFSKQQFTYVNDDEKYRMENLRELYINALEPTYEYMLFYHQLDKNDVSHQRVAKAATFDVLRGILPFGANTNLSWTTNFKVFNDHIARLRTVQDNFFGLRPLLDKMVELVQGTFKNSVFENRDDGALKFVQYFDNYDSYYNEHKFKNGSTFFETQFMLDIASWRDLARHRSIEQSFPHWNFADNYKLWDIDKNNMQERFDVEFFYTDFLPLKIKQEITTKILNTPPHCSLYALPMAVKIPVVLSGSVEKLKYILKLRTSRTVHPTLRHSMIQLAKKSNMMNLISERNRSAEWILDIKRGDQTITCK